MFISNKITIYNRLYNMLKFFQKNYFEKYHFVKYQNHLGRWKLEKDIHKINIKVDLSNEDHCGVCNEYSNNIINNKNEENIKYYLLCETPDYKK